MKEDYLWDKTGDDPEIKKLEKTLAVFRYQETATPALPASKGVSFAEQPRRRTFSLAFAFAACAAGVILFGVWFLISNGRVGPDKDPALAGPPEIKSETRNGSIVDSIDGPHVEKVETVKQTVGRNSANARQSVALRNKTVARTLEDKKRGVTLTTEEKYAYRQLMLALSITSSKLKIVQDKVNGIEDRQTNVTENNR